MSVHEDLLNNGENNCSFTEDEVDIMCSKDGDDACGDCDNAPKEKYLKLLEFRHFERHILFSQSERKDKKKAISSGVNVQVVVGV